MFDVSESQKFGVGFCAFGASFLLLGILLFFDRGLLAIGNLFFVFGLSLAIGLTRTWRFFRSADNLWGTVLFFGGIGVILTGWTVLGTVVEVAGFSLVFGSHIPTAVNFLRCVPVASTILSLPGLSTVADFIAPQ